MSDSPAERARELCITAALIEGVTGWTALIGRRTDSPNRQVIFTDYDIGGENPNPAYRLDFLRVQVIVRGNVDAYGEAYDKARTIKEKLLGLGATTHSNGDRWSGVTMIGDIGFMQYDEKNRPMFSMNFRILHEPAIDTFGNRASL